MVYNLVMGKNMKRALASLAIVAIALVLYHLFVFLQKDVVPGDRFQGDVAMNEGQFPGPGGCRGDEACRSYCEDAAHFRECLEFSLEAGFISLEEFEHIMGSSTDESLGVDQENSTIDASSSPETLETATSSEII